MPTFTWIASWNSRLSKKPKVDRAEFADGYSQRAASTINNNPEMWSLRFDVLDSTTANAIMDFLDARGGVEAFDWANPRGVTIKVTCSEYSQDFSGFGNSIITANFVQDFSP